jgi:hypothetical protein
MIDNVNNSVWRSLDVNFKYNGNSSPSKWTSSHIPTLLFQQIEVFVSGTELAGAFKSVVFVY